MTAWPYSAALVVLASAGLWLALVALEHLPAWIRARRGQRVSDASLAAYARDEMREAAPQYAVWPKQKKGAVGLWDRRPAKLRDVSRRAS